MLLCQLAPLAAASAAATTRARRLRRLLLELLLRCDSRMARLWLRLPCRRRRARRARGSRARRSRGRRRPVRARCAEPLRPICAPPRRLLRLACTSCCAAVEVDREASERATRQRKADAVRAGCARVREHCIDLPPRAAAAEYGRRRRRRRGSAPKKIIAVWENCQKLELVIPTL